MAQNRKIELLSDEEHVLLRPQMYVSSVEETDEVVHYVDDKQIIRSRVQSISVGMYKIFMEILDNAFDAVKRAKSHKKSYKAKIKVTLDSITNKVTITDNAEGFYKGTERNPKSKVTNIETAYAYLKSGTNWDNENSTEVVIGTNGMGGSLTNVLSDHFFVFTTNKTRSFTQTWKQFKTTDKPVIHHGQYAETGTMIEFIPRVSVFKKLKYDVELIRSQIIFRAKCLKLNPLYHDVEITFTHKHESGGFGAFSSSSVETEDFIISGEFVPATAFEITGPDFYLAIAPRYTSENFMMVNSTQCSGSPMKYIQEILNDQIFKHPKAELYYHIDLLMNLPPALTKFKDQIKTQYGLPKAKIAPHIDVILKKKIKGFLESFAFKQITEDIHRNELDKEKKALNKEKGKNRQITKKYFPAAKVNDILFLVEGDSAKGPVVGNRDTNTQGVYALRGKIKNCSKLADLRSDPEIMDIISILGLEFGSDKCNYNRIAITADADYDGYHIAALLYNFFYRWFPKVVDAGKLYIFQVPLIAYGIGKTAQYLYSLNEIEGYNGNKSNARYLKGLGALDEQDWPNIMQHMKLLRVKSTPKSLEQLDIIFGNSSQLRKDWLNEA